MRLPWSARPPAAPERWLVVDVESSGLDPRRDRLLAIAAVAVMAGPRQLCVRPADSFELLLQQPDSSAAPDKANILLHGIGLAAQRQGVAPAAALQAFVRFAAGAPLLGFHAAFDRCLLDRAARQWLGAPLRAEWVDLADLAPVLHPGVRARALDEWLAHFGIPCLARHQAAADALATAELLQRLWPGVVAEQACSFRRLTRLAARRRWLGG